MVHHLPGKLMVDILHPAGCFALAFPDGTGFLGLLQFLATSIELTAHHALIAPIAKEPCSLATEIGYSRNLDTEINTHHPVLLYWLGFLKSHSDIGYPLAPFLLDAQETGKPYQFHFSTLHVDLLCLAV